MQFAIVISWSKFRVPIESEIRIDTESLVDQDDIKARLRSLISWASRENDANGQQYVLFEVYYQNFNLDSVLGYATIRERGVPIQWHSFASKTLMHFWSLEEFLSYIINRSNLESLVCGAQDMVCV